MPVKTIIVGLRDDSAFDHVYVAMDLAALFDAGLVGFGSREMSALIGMDTSGTLVQAAHEVAEQAIATMEEAFITKVTAERRTGWRAAIGPADQALAIESRAADLIVVDGSTDPRSLGSLILTAGRPVFVAAAERKGVSADRIVVGWKDTREARRAVADALPFLTRAKDVVLAFVDEGDGIDSASAAEVNAYLGSHGVKSRVETAAAARGENAGDTLHDIARHSDADLIVAGAYGFSRFREMIFGGVTNSLLRDRTIHHLMSS